MGYQVSVTPLQMAAAVSAVANGGLLMEPRIVRAVRRDGTREVVAPKVLRRAITSETAATVRRIMEGVVSRGTARVAQIEGYPAAGKTGTAHKVAENGGYSRSDYNASFVGFVPARNPEFTILVVIDTPRTSIYGGVVAAPVFRRIAEAALQYRGVPAEVQQPVPVTPLRAAYTARPRPRPEVMPTPVSFTGGAALMPDVRGLSGREAVRVLARVGIVARVTGSGFVHEQTPAAGTPVDTDTVGRLALQRDPDPPANSREASR
jgi:cell division protein FtsI (penicillin-binding protein 3)